MMKKLMVALILSLLMAAPALCETSLWVAKTDSTITYIGGTVHFLRKSDYPFPPAFAQAYAASDKVVFETDMAELSSLETQQVIMGKATYADGRTLDSVLSDEAWQKLEEYCAENSLNPAALNPYKPWMVMISMLSIEQQKLGADQEGLDAIYFKQATADGKPTGALESVETQIEVLTTMGDGYENALVIHSVDEMDKMEVVFDSLVAAWRTGDEAILFDLVIEDAKEEFPVLFKDLFVDRNNNWVPAIEQYLTTPETEFILVGVGHLVGEEGVIAQLKERGYAVEKFENGEDQ